MSLGIDVHDDFDSVPVIDFAGMLGGDPAEKAKVAAALRDACSNVGFFYIRNHGVPLPLIAEMFAQSARFFRLPLEDKAALHVKKSPHLVGYVGMLEENADPAVSKGDIHEGYDFIAEDVETAAGFLEGDLRKTGNQWPANLPGFHEVMTEYTIAVRLLARRLFAAFALGLDLPEDYFVPMSNRPMALTRMMYYPSETGPLDLTRMGVGAHTDHECFTILAQDVQGINDSQFMHANIVPGSLGAATITQLQALKPYPYYSSVNVTAPTLGNSIYHAGFLSVQKRLSHGLVLLADQRRARGRQAEEHREGDRHVAPDAERPKGGGREGQQHRRR